MKRVGYKYNMLLSNSRVATENNRGKTTVLCLIAIDG